MCRLTCWLRIRRFCRKDKNEQQRTQEQIAQDAADLAAKEIARKQKDAIQRRREQRLSERLSEVERLIRTNDPHPRH